jgi:hypothetical protein
MSVTPFVVEYDEIPAVDGAPSAAKFRQFVGERLLGAMVPGRGVGMELVQVPAGERVARRTSARCLMIVLEGGADLIAEAHHTVRLGDAVTIPESFAYGLIAGSKGFEALVVSFSSRPGEARKQVYTHEQLLARNQERTQAALQKPFFRKLTGALLRDPADRRRFQDGLLFLSQLRKELGSKDLLTGQDAAPVVFDPVLQATATWFRNQMFVLDDLDKTVVNLVLGTAGSHLAPEGDQQKVGLHLLEDQPPQVYQRLAAVLERSWDMFEAMTGRIVELVESRKEGLAHGS